MHFYWHDGSRAWLLMIPMMLVFLAAIGAVVWAIVYSGRSHTSPGTHAPGPEEVLAHRLARGEIDPAEYHERLEALRSQPH